MKNQDSRVVIKKTISIISDDISELAGLFPECFLSRESLFMMSIVMLNYLQGGTYFQIQSIALLSEGSQPSIVGVLMGFL